MRRTVRSLAGTLLVAATFALALPASGVTPDLPAFVRFVGSSGAGAGQLDAPVDVVVSASGNWFVADYANDRVQVFGPAGAFLRTIGSSGSGPTQLDAPAGLAIVDDASVGRQRLLVADSFNDRLQLFEMAGGHVQTVSSVAGATPPSFNAPAGIVVADDGRIIVADRIQQRVLVLSPTFTLVHEIELSGVSPTGVALAPGDEVLYVASNANQIRRFDLDSAAPLDPIELAPIGPGIPYHLRVDDIGFLYLGVTSQQIVRKISPAGEQQWSFGGFGTAEGKFSAPFAATVTPDGLLAVPEESNDRVQVFDLCPTGFPDVPDSHPFWFEICWMDTENVSTGFPDGTYRPAIPVTRQAMAAFLARATDASVPAGPASPTFPDVPTSHPFYDEIEWMAAEGIADGFPDGTFRPTAPVSRQAMSAFMQRASGLPLGTPPGTPTFSDVDTGHPFRDEIEWMAANGVADGFPDGTYRPTQPVTRQAMSAFLARLALIA